jgi:hypothetical protein
MLRAGLTLCVLAGAITGVTLAGAEGRYKKDGTKCVWDAKDNGPDQCQPTATGRFKKSGDTCTWAAGEKGQDECTPSKGRFKKDGNKCEWNATDSGPNQCDPRQAAK